MNPMVDVKDYADIIGVGVRTVMNYLAADRIPGARKVAGKWMIPADAQPTQHAVIQHRVPAADIIATPTPEPVAPIRIKRQPVPVAVLAQQWGLPADTVRRWAKAGEGGLSLSTGPQSAHYVWVELA